MASRSNPWWTTAAFFAAGIAAVQLGTRAILWFLPYHVAGFVNELALFALSCLFGLGLFLWRRRHPKPPARQLAVVAAGCLYLIASAAGLSWSAREGLGFGVHQYALFSTPTCDFTARFERPPQYGRVKGVLSLDRQAADSPLLYVAVLADVATATAFRAECLPVGGEKEAAQVAQNLAAGLRGWIEEMGMRRSNAVLRDDPRGPVLAIDGEIGGSILPEREGKASRTLVGLRSYVGPRSVMTVYVFQPQGEALSADALAFLDGVQRK